MKRIEPKPNWVSVTVAVTGTCDNGHNVTSTVTINVPPRSHGVHTCTARCAGCDAPVHMAGNF